MDNVPIETSKPYDRFLKWLWPTLAFLPAIVPLAAIIIYGVNVPFGDEWDIAGPIFYKISQGTLHFSDIIAQHNEHRIAMTRLIVIAIGRLTHYNLKAEMVSTWLVACATSLLVLRVGQKTLYAAEDCRRPWSYVTWYLANVMIFSLIQYENWLWGMEVHFYLPTFCMLAALLLMLSSLPRVVIFIPCVALAIISTYSAANGMIIWLLLIPSLRRAGRPASLLVKDIWTALWAVFAAATIWSYFHGYVKPPQHPSILEALRHPIQFMFYFLIYLGGPLGYGTVLDVPHQSIGVGTVVIILYVAAVVYAWRNRRDESLITRALPWLALGAYVIGTDVITDVARLGFGLDQALAPRYTTISAAMFVALIYLLPMLSEHALVHWATPDRKRFWEMAAPRIGPALAGAMLILSGPVGIYAVVQCQVFRNFRTTGQAALMFIDLFQDEALVGRTAGNPGQVPVVHQMADVLNSMGYIHPPLVKDARITPFIAPEQRGVTTPGYYGYLEVVIPVAPPGQLGLQGWAIFPDKVRCADAVLLTYQIGNGEPVVFGVGDTAQPRPDVATALDHPSYKLAGFVKTFPANLLPSGDLKIQAWALDMSTLKAYQVTNTIPIHNGP